MAKLNPKNMDVLAPENTPPPGTTVIVIVVVIVVLVIVEFAYLTCPWSACQKLEAQKT